MPSSALTPSLDLSGFTQFSRPDNETPEPPVNEDSQSSTSYSPLQTTPILTTQESSTYESDVDDNESILSDLSETSVSKAKISVKAIKNFLEHSKHSKKIIEVCTDFNPDLKDLTLQLMNYRATQRLTTATKARILKLVNKIYAHSWKAKVNYATSLSTTLR